MTFSKGWTFGRKVTALATAALVATLATQMFAFRSDVSAKDTTSVEDLRLASDDTPSNDSDGVTGAKKRHGGRRQTNAAIVPKAQPSRSPDGRPPEPATYSAQLDKAGASACRGQINALATSTMSSVVEYNTVSSWSPVAGDKRAVGLAIGQRYAQGSAVPFSVSQVFSAPNQQGSCDGFAVQVFPSPLSCDQLRLSIATHGQQIGNLAGIPLMQDGSGRTMLVPTASNTCVLVATRSMYAN